MRETVPTVLLQGLLQATPGELAAVGRFLGTGVPLPGGGAAESCSNMAGCFRAVLAGGSARCVGAGGRCRVAGAADEAGGKVEGNGQSNNGEDGAAARSGMDEPAGILMAIHQDVKALRVEMRDVRRDFIELRTAKERLEKMLADGMFTFTRKVDATSFKVLCAILGEGDVAKAARSLGMPDPSLRTIMRRWRTMGKEYRAMLDLVRWRKAVGRRESVPLNDNVLLQKASNVDYPALLSEVLDGLLSMNEENWREKVEELEEMLRGTGGC